MGAAQTDNDSWGVEAARTTSPLHRYHVEDMEAKWLVASDVDAGELLTGRFSGASFGDEPPSRVLIHGDGCCR
jgi:hypothetical protein